MSSTESIATPAIPTSPDTRGWSESYLTLSPWIQMNKSLSKYKLTLDASPNQKQHLILVAQMPNSFYKMHSILPLYWIQRIGGWSMAGACTWTHRDPAWTETDQGFLDSCPPHPRLYTPVSLEFPSEMNILQFQIIQSFTSGVGHMSVSGSVPFNSFCTSFFHSGCSPDPFFSNPFFTDSFWLLSVDKARTMIAFRAFSLVIWCRSIFNLLTLSRFVRPDGINCEWIMWAFRNNKVACLSIIEVHNTCPEMIAFKNTGLTINTHPKATINNNQCTNFSNFYCSDNKSWESDSNNHSFVH